LAAAAARLEARTMNVPMAMLRAVRDGVVMAGRLWPWSLLAFLIDFGTAMVPDRPGAAAFVTIVALVAGAIITMRFYAAFLGVDWRAVLSDRAQFGRYVAWYCFVRVLALVGMSAGMGGYAPPVVLWVCSIGAWYFMLRLIAVLPAIVAWRAWPGIDRVWNASGRLALRIAATLIVLFLAAGVALAVVVTAMGLDPRTLPAVMPGATPAAGRALLPYAAGLGVLAVLFQSMASAFAVACFREVEAAPKSMRRG